MEMNAAAQILIAVLPVVAVITLGVLVFFYFLWEYRQNMKLIETGASPRPARLNDNLLLFGMVSLFVGAGLLVFFLISEGFSGAILGGIVPLSAGAGIIVHWVIVRNSAR